MADPRGQLCRWLHRAAGDDFGQDAHGRPGRGGRDLPDPGDWGLYPERLVAQHGAVLLEGHRPADHHHHGRDAGTGSRTGPDRTPAVAGALL